MADWILDMGEMDPKVGRVGTNWAPGTRFLLVALTPDVVGVARDEEKQVELHWYPLSLQGLKEPQIANENRVSRVLFGAERKKQSSGGVDT